MAKAWMHASERLSVPFCTGAFSLGGFGSVYTNASLKKSFSSKKNRGTTRKAFTVRTEWRAAHRHAISGSSEQSVPVCAINIIYCKRKPLSFGGGKRFRKKLFNYYPRRS